MTQCKRTDVPQGVESVTPYGSDASKTGQVEQMFDAIAPAYDFMNTAMSFGLHRYWRDRALARVAPLHPRRVLDVATGTGDVAFAIWHRFHPDLVEGLDLSEGMLSIARKRLEASSDARMHDAMRFVQGDSLHLPYHDGSFDAVTVAYGVRNFEHLQQGLREMARVLRPGGMLCVVELSVPRNKLCRAAYNFYSRHIIPTVGKIVSHDSRAYSYLPESIASAPQRDALTLLMERAGLHDCKWQSLTFGVVTVYTAVR